MLKETSHILDLIAEFAVLLVYIQCFFSDSNRVLEDTVSSKNT